MQHRWLSLFSIGAISIMVLILFWNFNKPVEINFPDANAEIEFVAEPSITFVNPSKGSDDAVLTIVEFGDFECGPCQALAVSLEVVHKTYPDEVRVVWKNLPNESIHQLATPAAVAAHCADKQGKFWEYHDELFVRQTYLSESQFDQIAVSVGLDEKKFSACNESRDTLPIVKKDYNEGLGLGLTATPTLFIADEIITGAITTEDLLSKVAKALSSL
jgi:protein-disulfide isomerase